MDHKDKNTWLMLGDCLKRMEEIPDSSIDLTVTSPPYDNLRTYNGNNALWGDHVWEAVIKDLYRVTKEGGVVVWIVGDATIKGSETGTSFRQALWAKKCGFNLTDTMIYECTGTGAKGSNRLYWQGFEYMFVLSKGRHSTFNAIIDKKNKRMGAVQTSGRVRPNGELSDRKRRVTPSVSKRTNVWRIHAGNNGDDKTSHPAMFPEALARDHIISWSNARDTVLDPFMGSGTTGKMALLNDRKFIGIELDPVYFDIAKDRIGKVKIPVNLFDLPTHNK